jgi:hypothetical protein
MSKRKVPDYLIPVRDSLRNAGEAILQVIKQKTNDYWEKIVGPKGSGSEKAKKLGLIINRIDICDGGKDAVCELVSELIGEKVIRDDREIEFEPGVMVKVINESNDHNYGTGAVVFITNESDDEHISIETGEGDGNSLPDELNCFKRPTESEMEKLFNNRREEITRKFIDIMVI